MTAPRDQADADRVVDLLCAWINRQSSIDEVDWLRARQAEIEKGAPDWKFFTAFSAAPRHLSKEDLDLSASDLSDAARLRAGWTPEGWSVDEAARTVLLLSYPCDERERYVAALDQLFSTADTRESIALYQVLPLYPHPDAFRARAAEGLRSNMTSVFNAVAHENPYPKEYLDQAAWSQMVLKALFVGSVLYRIQGLDERANAELARMLVDFARERWAAHRSVPPELWRPVGPFADDELAEEIGTLLESDSVVEREAAALALADARSEAASALLSQQPELKRRLESGELSWESFSRNRIPIAA
jgi:hypothetical protein